MTMHPSTDTSFTASLPASYGWKLEIRGYFFQRPIHSGRTARGHSVAAQPHHDWIDEH
jgi:hypothetical protein